MSRIRRTLSIALSLFLWACKKAPPPPRFPELPEDAGEDLPEGEEDGAHL
jgi:hypothetical protein